MLAAVIIIYALSSFCSSFLHMCRILHCHVACCLFHYSSSSFVAMNAMPFILLLFFCCHLHSFCHYISSSFLYLPYKRSHSAELYVNNISSVMPFLFFVVTNNNATILFLYYRRACCFAAAACSMLLKQAIYKFSFRLAFYTHLNTVNFVLSSGYYTLHLQFPLMLYYFSYYQQRRSQLLFLQRFYDHLPYLFYWHPATTIYFWYSVLYVYFLWQNFYICVYCPSLCEGYEPFYIHLISSSFVSLFYLHVLSYCMPLCRSIHSSLYRYIQIILTFCKYTLHCLLYIIFLHIYVLYMLTIRSIYQNFLYHILFFYSVYSICSLLRLSILPHIYSLPFYSIILPPSSALYLFYIYIFLNFLLLYSYISSTTIASLIFRLYLYI